MVMISSVLAVPLTLWVFTSWLEHFAYRAEPNYLLYAMITLTALVFVFLVVLIQSLHTAQSNPVDSLKYE